MFRVGIFGYLPERFTVIFNERLLVPTLNNRCDGD